MTVLVYVYLPPLLLLLRRGCLIYHSSGYSGFSAEYMSWSLSVTLGTGSFPETYRRYNFIAMVFPSPLLLTRSA